MSSTKLDISILNAGAFGEIGDRVANVAANATTIYPGEPVAGVLGTVTVIAMATNKPVVGTDYLMGIASSTSTQTASVAGTVKYKPLVPGVVYIASAKVAADVDTQAKYDALVNKRVLIDLTGGVYTMLSADGATSGCVIEPLDIVEHPGKIAFSFRNNLSTRS